jgi:2,3-bisphosphoglycerate-independent phosphoglycerate mutase
MTASASARPPVVLVVRDGWGRNPNPEHDAFNAVVQARTPVADELLRTWPATLVRTCGEDVGLPPGTMGNSEVGHQNIGAGRVVDQEVQRINKAIADGAIEENEAIGRLSDHLRRTGGRLHLLGLASDAQVHSDIAHLLALIDLVAARDLPGDRLVVHAITDGRDTGPRTGLGFVDRVQSRLDRAGVGRIGSVMGRYWAMDRDNRWDRVARAYACLTGGPAAEAASAAAAVQSHYDVPEDPGRIGDEFVPPTRIPGASGGAAHVEDGDAVFFFNYRGDRPREITKAFVYDDAAWAAVPGGGFDRGAPLRDLRFCTMSQYEEGLPVDVAFPRPPHMTGILGAVMETTGRTQFRCAETEKFPHVTYFFNDYREEPFEGEHRLLVPSPRDVATYDQKPEMSASGVRDAVLERLRADDVEPLIVVNFANADMVGHTGDLEATTRAVEVVDACVGALVEATLARDGSLVVTADHGNAEQMWDPELDAPYTAHTVYDVDLFVVGERYRSARLRDRGRLGDISPTLLEMMEMEVPREMTGESLLS